MHGSDMLPDEPPLRKLFTDPQHADVLAAVLGLGFGADEWQEVWKMRAVTPECYRAVHTDDVWRQMYEKLSADKAPPPPALRTLLELSKETRVEQLRQRPDLRIGAFFECFLLGLTEAERTEISFQELTSLTFHVRAKGSAGTIAERERLCDWWQNRCPRRSVYGADGRMRTLTHEDGVWRETGSVPWAFAPAPVGSGDGTFIHTVDEHGVHHLWQMRRLACWAWLLVTAHVLKCSIPFPTRFEPHEGPGEAEPQPPCVTTSQLEDAARLTQWQAQRLQKACTQLPPLAPHAVLCTADRVIG